MDLINQTTNLTETKILHGEIANEVQAYHLYTLDIIEKMCRHKKTKTRLYINGENNEEYLTKVYNSPPKNGESIQTWTERVLKNLKFGLVVNNVEIYSEGLLRKIVDRLKSTFTKTNYPSGGCDIVLFIGNYGYTPFGIHKDYIGGKVLHFHLGPGSKTMLLWDDERYKDLGGFQNFQEVERVKFAADIFSFDAGDLFFMPEDIWHVGYTEKLSIGLAVRFNYNNAMQNLKEMLNFLETALIKKSNEINSFNVSDVEKSQNEFNFDLDNYYKKLTIEPLIQRLYNEKRLSILSNCGFYAPPLSISADGKKIEKGFRINVPYRIYYLERDKNEIIIFARGTQFLIENNYILMNIINKFNREEEFLFSNNLELLKNKQVVSLLQQLYRLRAIVELT